jgi:hypothetical protein
VPHLRRLPHTIFTVEWAGVKDVRETALAEGKLETMLPYPTRNASVRHAARLFSSKSAFARLLYASAKSGLSAIALAASKRAPIRCKGENYGRQLATITMGVADFRDIASTPARHRLALPSARRYGDRTLIALGRRFTPSAALAAMPSHKHYAPSGRSSAGPATGEFPGPLCRCTSPAGLLAGRLAQFVQIVDATIDGDVSHNAILSFAR